MNLQDTQDTADNSGQLPADIPQRLVICQGCLHVTTYTLRRHEGLEPCIKCGEDYCGCPDCHAHARSILKNNGSNPQ